MRGRFIIASPWQVVSGFVNEKADEKEKAKPYHLYMTGGDIPPKFTDSTLRIRNFGRTKTGIECDNIFLMMSTLLAPLLAKQQDIIRRILSCLYPSCITSSINISETKSVHTHIDHGRVFLRSRIHEPTISLRFLGILRFEVSVWIS